MRPSTLLLALTLLLGGCVVDYTAFPRCDDSTCEGATTGESGEGSSTDDATGEDAGTDATTEAEDETGETDDGSSTSTSTDDAPGDDKGSTATVGGDTSGDDPTTEGGG